MTGAGPPASRLVALVCPACGDDLAGLPADRVFSCARCAAAYSVEGGGLRADPLVWWKPETAAEHVYLPLWMFEVEAVVVLPQAGRAPRAAGAAVAERRVPFGARRVFVTAFDLRGRSRFGDPGLHFTRKQPEPPIREGGPAVVGAVLGRAVATEIVPAEILGVVDARTDVLGGRAEAEILSASLVAVPFECEEGGGVREPDGGVSYPPAAIPDLESIRRTQRG